MKVAFCPFSLIEVAHFLLSPEADWFRWPSHWEHRQTDALDYLLIPSRGRGGERERERGRGRARAERGREERGRERGEDLLLI